LRTFLAKCSRSMPPSLALLPLPPAPVVATVGVVPKRSKRITAPNDSTSCVQPLSPDHAMALSSLFSSSLPPAQAEV
jgi:hypothetical protein